MAIKAIDREFLKYFLQLNDHQKKSLLQFMQAFIDKDMHIPSTLEEYNHDIDYALKQVDRGEYTTLEELEKEMQSWNK
jgi:nucleoid-associated protein YejK